MTHFNRLVAVTAMVAMAVAGTTNLSFAIEKTVRNEAKKPNAVDLPPAVLAAFHKTYPKSKVTKADKETKDSTVYYEIESVDGKMKRNILYLPDGAVYEVEEAVPASSLPREILARLSADNPKARVERAERITRGTVIEYEVGLEAGEDKSEVVLDATGKILKSEKLSGKEEDESGEESD